MSKKKEAPAPSSPAPKKQEVKSQIQRSIDRAHEEHKRELFKRRIELARQGVRNFQLKRLADAVKAFQTYLRILEDWKGVSEGGLHPGLFDVKLDAPELVLIAGIYWDLTKLYDRTEKKEEEFRHYLEKFLIFSKGMTYQPLSGETLRKYINNEKPVHLDEFKNAYKALVGTGCFVATALSDVTGESTLFRLRRFRDEVLHHSNSGRNFEFWYYRNGPGFAAAVNRLPNVFRRILAVSLMAISLFADRITDLKLRKR